MKNSVRLTRFLMTTTGPRLTLWLGLCGCLCLNFWWAGNGFGFSQGQAVRAAAQGQEGQAQTGRNGVKQPPAQPAHDDISPEQRAQIEREIAAYYAKHSPVKAPATPQAVILQKFPFYPIGGTLWKDLDSSFIDVNTADGVIQTWHQCEPRTYDNHSGHDIGFGKYYEMGVGNQNFGIPIFAALDGVVVFMHDGEFDQVNDCDENNQPVGNTVVLDHGNGQRTLYTHFKKNSIRVNVGDTVFAGKELGHVGSSGCSSAPHLHFEPQMLNPDTGRYVQYEPYSGIGFGACNQVASGWVNQTPLNVPSNFLVRDFWFSSTDNYDPDVDTRVGSFLVSNQFQTVRASVQFTNFPAGAVSLTIKRPDGTNFLGPNPGSAYGPRYSGYYGVGGVGVIFDMAGTWRYILEAGGQTLVDAPMLAVATAPELGNRPPNPVTVSLDPPNPKTSDVIFCRVNTNPAQRDPDYDRVKYRYVWQVNGVTKRDVTTPVLSDALERGMTSAGSSVTCTVTPSDDTVSASPAMASAVTPCPVITLSPASLPNGLVNIGYNQTITASGGTANDANPYTFSLNAGTLPTGLSLAANGLLSGTPSASGTFNFTIKATDKAGCMGTQAYTLTMNQPCLSLTVNNLGDTPDANPGNQLCADSGGNCTLRAALMEANANTTCAGSPIPINFSVTGTITLGSALPTIAYANLSLNGPGANQLTVSGNNARRVFNIGSGAFNVSFSGLTIANGRVDNSSSGGNAQGGGIFNASTGTVNVINCMLSGNAVMSGGGSTGFGGGIFHGSTGTLNVLNSTLVSNSATGTVHGWGGGICNSSTGTVNVTNSTLSGNSAIANPGSGSLRAQGGALANQVNGTVNVTNSTITGNSSTNFGGGIVNGITVLNAGTVVSIKNSIVAGNTAPTKGPDVYSGASFTSLGFNLIGKVDDSSGFSPPNDLIGTIAVPLDPKLAPLANNGGPTQTHALLTGSPAIDKGAPSVTTDQRGLPRPYDFSNIANAANGSDIGAFELQPQCPTITLSALPNGTVGTPYSQTITASGGTAPYTFNVSVGTLPTGLSLNTNSGVLSGTPTASGNFGFTIKATDANGCMGTQAYTVQISCPTITVNPSNPTLTNGTTGTFYTQTFTQTGGTGAITWSISAGTLPGNVSLNSGSGVLSGTPTANGNFNFTVRATDSNGCFGQRAYTLTIGGCPTITINPTNPVLPAGTAGQAYNQTFTQTGGTGTITWSVSAGALPTGLTLNSASGVLSGTSYAPGTYSFTITATGANSCSGSRAYTLTLAPGPCAPIPANLVAWYPANTNANDTKGPFRNNFPRFL